MNIMEEDEVSSIPCFACGIVRLLPKARVVGIIDTRHDEVGASLGGRVRVHIQRDRFIGRNKNGGKEDGP